MAKPVSPETTAKAIKAIKKFKFWDYGMDDVDPKSKYAEWVPHLAAAVLTAVLPEHERIVREKVAAEFLALQREFAADDAATRSQRTRLSYEAAARIARGGVDG